MDLNSKIYVAGHMGLVGSAVVKCLRDNGYTNLLLRTHRELDLTNQYDVKKFLQTERPEYVFLAAAKVGGILANSSFPADFILHNLNIELNIIGECKKNNVKRLLFLGSSCIYPKLAPQPLREEFLLTGSLEITNRSYAIAKIAGIEMCSAMNRQYGTRFLAAMPTNLYGPGDNYDLHNSHLIPALIRKMHEAKLSGANKVIVWGTGTPRREFLYSEDAADACVFLMNLPDRLFEALISKDEHQPLINIGCGNDMTIAEIANLVAQIVGFEGQLLFDTAKPDGTPRKLLNIDRLQSLGWTPKTSLGAGLRLTYDDFCSNAYSLTASPTV